MRILALLAVVAVSCSATTLSVEQIQGLLETEGAPSSSGSNLVLLIIWTELHDLSEQVSKLTEATTSLQCSTDSLKMKTENLEQTSDALQSGMALMKARLEALEKAMEGKKNKVAK